jgi:threonine dehydrogenase-like Zn-dependent dehydrogenase
MRGAALYAPGDVRFEERADPAIIEPTDAIIRMSATCVCRSDLWPYRGICPTAEPTPMGHEYCGIVEDVGRAVTSIRRGQFVIGSFFASDNSCPHCRAGYQTSCQHKEFVGGAQAPLLRVPLADGWMSNIDKNGHARYREQKGHSQDERFAHARTGTTRQRKGQERLLPDRE